MRYNGYRLVEWLVNESKPKIFKMGQWTLGLKKVIITHQLRHSQSNEWAILIVG